jgi:hypothetical protein
MPAQGYAVNHVNEMAFTSGVMPSRAGGKSSIRWLKSSAIEAHTPSRPKQKTLESTPTFGHLIGRLPYSLAAGNLP